MKEKQNKNSFIKDVLSLFIIIFSLVTLLSLLSFNKNESPLFVSSPGKITNWGGIAGVYWASILKLIFGKASFGIPIIIFTIGWGILLRKNSSYIYFKLIGLVLFIISLSVVLTKATILSKGELIESGGITGFYLKIFLLKYLGKAGTVSLLLGLFLISIMLIFKLTLENVWRVFKNIWKIFPKIFTKKIKNKEENKIEKPPLIAKVTQYEEEKEEEKLPETQLPAPVSKVILLKQEEGEEITPVETKTDYIYPPFDYLKTSPPVDVNKLKTEVSKTVEKLEKTFEEFSIKAKVVNIQCGPVITRYELTLAPGIKLNKVVSLSDNIALSLAAQRVRIVAPIPGKNTIGVEVPNKIRSMVTLGDIITLPEFQKEYKPVEVALGKDIAGNPIKINIRDCPHLLIAGATGSGKSVCLNSIIMNLIYFNSPSELKFLLIDPKFVELKIYNGIPHLLYPVITNPREAISALKYLVYEMENRYKLLDKIGARDIIRYNQKVAELKEEEFKVLPYIILIIDEFADLMMMVSKQIEELIVRLAQKARAVGIHLILATQRPSVDVITGLIKANFPTRIAFQVASKVDSRTILDTIGAEKLLGKGDMLLSMGNRPGLVRIQGAYVSDEEIEHVIEFIIKNSLPPEHIDIYNIPVEAEESMELNFSNVGENDEDLYRKALEIIKVTKKASASYLQRRLKIGFNRAARLIDLMEKNGIIGPQIGNKPREVYLDKIS